MRLSSKIVITVVVGAVLTVFTFSDALFRHASLSWKDAWRVVPMIVAMLFTVAQDVRDERWHRSLIEGDRLKWLRGLGFTIEHLDDYWGYKGTYRGYFMRIYFDPDGRGRNYDHSFRILLHYAPPRRADGQADMRRIRALQEEMTPSIFALQPGRMQYHFRFLAYLTPFNAFTGARRIKRRIDRSVDLAVAHRLDPESEEHVQAYILRSAEHGPQVRTFLDAMARMRGHA